MSDNKHTEYLTIKQFAEKVGISNQAVYQRLNKDLNKFVKVLDNKKMLNGQALGLFNVKSVDQEKASSLTSESSNSINLTSALQSQIEQLKDEIHRQQQQLELKDKHIFELTNSLEKQNDHSRQMSDKLVGLLEQVNELQRNNQVLLAKKDTGKLEITKQTEETGIVTEPNFKESKKKGFLSRFFDV